MSVRSSSTSTRIVNGRKVTTKKVVDNGVETVTTYENDVLKSQTVNGVPQAVTNHGQQQARATNTNEPDQASSTGNLAAAFPTAAATRG